MDDHKRPEMIREDSTVDTPLI